MLPPALPVRSLEGVIHLAPKLQLQVPLLQRLVFLTLHRRFLDLLGRRDPLGLLAPPRLSLSLSLPAAIPEREHEHEHEYP